MLIKDLQKTQNCKDGKTPRGEGGIKYFRQLTRNVILSHLNILVGIMLAQLIYQNLRGYEFSISDLSMGLIKKEILDLRKSEKYLCENETLSFVLLAIEEKQLLKIFEIAIGLEIVVTAT